MDESLSAWVSWTSSSMRSVMSSTMTSRPTTLNLRVTSGAIATFTMRDSPRGSCQPEFIEIVDAGILADAVKLLGEGGRKNLAQRTPHHLPARLGIHDFHLRVPGLDAILQVHSHDADVDGFDNVLVEILEPLVLVHLLFK